MKKRLNIILTVLLVSMLGFGVCAEEKLINTDNNSPTIEQKELKNTATQTPVTKTTKPAVQHTIPLTNLVNPIDVVKKPSSYIGKKINVSARFDKFATLGLDYKPAFRSSETYISFLIMRNDTNKNIPLSEMKLFIKRSAAEKLIELKEGDKVQFTGTVFSSALGDAWVDVEKLEKIK
ncbi:MAG: hypothetical protein NC200_05695 [Candidatus Gastranaerophilales bacterium]|nr:hypothetical protein [Candidatus Gastranaerophilales bacterium]